MAYDVGLVLGGETVAGWRGEGPIDLPACSVAGLGDATASNPPTAIVSFAEDKLFWVNYFLFLFMPPEVLVGVRRPTRYECRRFFPIYPPSRTI